MPLSQISPLSPSSAKRTPSAGPRIKHFFWTAPYSSSVNPAGNLTLNYLDNHPLWTIDGFLPIARCRVDAFDLPPGAAPHAFTPVGVAENILAWVKYCDTRRTAAGKTYEHWTFFLQNWGVENVNNYLSDRENAFGLCLNWRDAVKNDQLVDPRSACNVFYCEQGIEVNRTWTRAFLESLASLLESENLYAPFEVHFDWESLIRSSWSIPTPPTEKGSWNYMLEDPRYSTELIDGNKTLQEYWDSAFNSSGLDLTFNDQQYVWNTSNIEFRVWYHGISMQVADYAIDEALYRPVREKFPGTECGNYLIYPKDKNHPTFFDKANEPNGPFNPFLMDRADFGAITAYPFPNAAFQDSGSLFANWLTRYNITPTGNDHADMTTLVMKAIKQDIRNTYLANPSKPLSIWMGFEGMGSDHPSGTYTNVGNLQWSLTWEMIQEIGEYAIEFANVQRLLWWQNPRYLFNMDPYVDVLNNLNQFALQFDLGQQPGVSAVQPTLPVNECEFSARLAIQNFIQTTARNHLFCQVTYDGQGASLATGKSINPKTAICNETASRHEPDQRMGRREIRKKTAWMFQLMLAFDSEVVMESFEELFSSVVPRLHFRGKGGYGSVAMRIVSSNYEHPTTKQPANGTTAIVTFEVDVGRM